MLYSTLKYLLFKKPKMTLRKRMIKKIVKFRVSGYTFLSVPSVLMVIIITTDIPYFCLLLPGIVCTGIGIDSLMSANYLKKRWCKELSLEKEYSELKPEENVEIFKLFANYFGCIL